MKSFLAMEKKKIIIVSLAVLVFFLLVVWWISPKKEPQESSAPALSPASNQAKPGEEKKKVILTYQPKAQKDPFKPLVEVTEDPGFLPPPEPIPEPLPLPANRQVAPQQPKEERKIILQGIVEDEEGYSALLNLGEKSMVVQPGDRLEGGLGQVVNITREQVLLQAGGGKIILEIGKD